MKQWFLIGASIIFVIIIFGIIVTYFMVNIIHVSELNALKNILSNNGEISASYEGWKILFVRLSSPDEPLNMRNVLIGLAGIITLSFAWWRLMIADQQKEDQVKRTNMESDKRLSEKFDNAEAAISKELDSGSFPTHSRAISDLRALAVNIPEYIQRCMDIICSCNQWMEGYIDEFARKGSGAPYSSWLLKEDNRIASKNQKDNITLLQEKRSQEVLAAISYILTKISTNNPEQIKALNFYNKMLCGISLNNLKLDDINFENTCLVAAHMNRTSLNKAKLNGANLQEASLDYAELQGAFLDYTNLQKVYLERAKLQGASLEHSKLQKASLAYTELQGASLVYTEFQGASLDHANLQGASLDHSNLQGASLKHSNLQRVSLERANLQGASLERANLQGASLDHANLQGTSLDHAKLQEASLDHAELQGIFLHNAELQSASLEDAKLQGALLINTQLQGAIMDKIDLSYAILLDCNLYGATLTDIKSKNIMFNDIADTGHIEDKIKSVNKAMKNKQKPEELDIICANSIINTDNTGLYDISEENLTNLQERWQKRTNEEGTKFLFNMRSAISSIGRNLLRYNNQMIDKNVNLKNKLEILVDQLIKNNKAKE